MVESLFSRLWYKVADLKIRLRTHATIHRHIYRDKIWYVLQDHVTGDFHRFTPQAYQLIGLMNGERTLQQIWDIACEKLGDDLPSQDQVIGLVGQLNKANVIQTNVVPDIKQLEYRRKSQQRNKFIQQLKSPLSIRIPLIDPEKFLTATHCIMRLIFNKLTALLWAIVVIVACVLAVIHWQNLTENLSDRILSIENLLLIACVYPVVKLIHELGHGYAVKHYGGEVHEMGVMFLIFIPVPYVDASAASSFRCKYQRMLVGGVGIGAELFLAAIAMIVWASAEPGIVRAIAFNTMLTGGISTLLFNGNPLLRFDAYYVLADYLEIPNLSSRGNAQVGYLIKRYAFLMKDIKSNAHSRSESFWLVLYAISAYIYRLFIMAVIALFIASKYLIIGVLLAIWSVWNSILLPILKVMAKPMTDHNMKLKQKRIITLSVLFISLIFIFLFFIPVPYKTYAQGVIYLPQQSYIKAEVSGFIDKLMVQDGDFILVGKPIIKMESLDLQARAEVYKAQVKEAQMRYEASVLERIESENLYQELQMIKREYQNAVDRLTGLTVYSFTSGELVIPNYNDIKGRYYNRGKTIGYIVNYDKLPLAVMISEDDIDRVKNATRSISVKLVSNPNEIYLASLSRQIPASTRQLPSMTLSTDGGGKIALDPRSDSPLTAYQNYFRLELEVKGIPKRRFDERVHVLFEHDPEPIMWRWYRNIRRVFLRQFYV